MPQFDLGEVMGAPASVTPKMSESDSDSSMSDPLDLTRDEDWEDVEPDLETVMVQSLFDEKTFTDVRSMLEHCKQAFDFDFMKIRAELDLDFLGTVKLINYIRSEVRAQNTSPSLLKETFEDDKYLKPVLEDDALLYSFDDLEIETTETVETQGQDAQSVKVRELEVALNKIQLQFTEYKEEAQKTMLRLLDDDTLELTPISLTSPGKFSKAEKQAHVGNLPPPSSTATVEDAGDRRNSDPEIDYDYDTGYFSSYEWNDIHETMLKDTIRTDAYRDFTYDNKHLFKDKVVLDVGCGTGILSMFCAKAGAKMVIAVDNSNIIDKAREIVFDNGLGDTVKCLRGKIEEVTLPVTKVDIIVSEWMGYFLLFEAMLDSVLWARDHYLSDTGLMVPSHATLRIAPIHDPDFVDSHVTFWNSVYGFNMSSMVKESYDQAISRILKPEVLAADSFPFLQLDLHKARTADLEFLKDFSATLNKDIDSLDAWAIWFDMFFMPSRQHTLPKNASPAEVIINGLVAFTTGPDGAETHWKQGVLLVDRRKKMAGPLKAGMTVRGQIGYRKRSPRSRHLEVDVKWGVEEVEEKGEQTWSID